MTMFWETKAFIVIALCMMLYLVGCGDDNSGFIQKDPVAKQQERMEKYTIYKGEWMLVLETDTPADLIERISQDVCHSTFIITVQDYHQLDRLLVTCMQ